MSREITRATELFLARKLRQHLVGFPEHRFIAMKGGGEGQDAQEIEPPVTIVAMGAPEQMYGFKSIWTIKGTVQVISHRVNMTVEGYSALVRAVYIALGQIIPDQSEPTFSFHGLDVGGMRDADDSEAQLHAEIIDVTVGVSGAG